MKRRKNIERQADALTKWVGSPQSILAHTIIFGTAFIVSAVGIVSFDRMLLVLTTLVSLEAIYLAIFIQMSVNRQAESLAEVEEDLDAIQENVDEIQEDIEDIQEDVEDIGEDVEELQEGVEEIGDDLEEMDETEAEEKAEERRKREQKETLENIYEMMRKLAADIENLKK